jgi:hypothetical protein
MENGQAGTWTYGEAREAALESMANVFPECPWECTEHQLDRYHEKAGCDDSTEIRADPAGQGGDVALPRVKVELVHKP